MDQLDALIRQLKKAESVNEIADAAGLDRSTVRRVRDRSHAPNMSTFRKLVAAVSSVNGKRKTVAG